MVKYSKNGSYFPLKEVNSPEQSNSGSADSTFDRSTSFGSSSGQTLLDFPTSSGVRKRRRFQSIIWKDVFLLFVVCGESSYFSCLVFFPPPIDLTFLLVCFLLSPLLSINIARGTALSCPIGFLVPYFALFDQTLFVRSVHPQKHSPCELFLTSLSTAVLQCSSVVLLFPS